MFNKFHHIGVAVKDMDASIALYESMGAKLLARETSSDGATDLAMLDLGGDLIEPISPIKEGHPSRQIHRRARRGSPPRGLRREEHRGRNGRHEGSGLRVDR